MTEMTESEKAQKAADKDGKATMRDANENEKKLLNLRDLAHRLELPMSWLREEASSGRIPCLRVGRRVLFSFAAVEESLLYRAGEYQVKSDRKESGVGSGPVVGKETEAGARSARRMGFKATGN